jgi:hypothetical protein
LASIHCFGRKGKAWPGLAGARYRGKTKSGSPVNNSPDDRSYDEAQKYWSLANQITAFAVVTILAFVYVAQGQVLNLAKRLGNCTDWWMATIGMPVFVFVVYGGAIGVLLHLELAHLNSLTGPPPSAVAKMIGRSYLVFGGRCLALGVFTALGTWSMFSVPCVE